MTLEEAIRQLLAFGERDGHVIAEKLTSRHKDESWFRDEVMAYAETFIAELAWRQISNDRRAAERAVRRNDASTATVLKQKTVWIPDVGAKEFADCTAEDLRARAAHLRMLAGTINKSATFCVQLADLVEYEGAATLGDVQSPLPDFPAGFGAEEMQLVAA